MHSRYMSLAIDEAKTAAGIGEIPVGAVIIRDGTIIARAHNMVESLNDPTAHAELLAIRAAAESLQSWRLEGCSLYVTLEPCPMCAGAILLSRVSELVFGAFDGDMGCCFSRADLTSGVLPRRVKTVGGVLEKECAALLSDFFRGGKREKK